MSVVKEAALNLRANAVCLDNELEAAACVKDGLGEMGSPAESASGNLSELAGSRLTVHQFEPVETATVHSVELTEAQSIRVRHEKIILNPACRLMPISIRMPEIQTLGQPQYLPTLVRDGRGFMIGDPAIQTRTSPVAEMPHMRRSICVQDMEDSERKGFLREAEVLKGIPSDRAELLAVFRHVPIEMISRLRFMAEKKVIIYGISSEKNPSQTRVHDLAAVLDIGNKEVHLVPHRTRFQVVSLNW